MAAIEHPAADILKVLEKDARTTPAEIATMTGRDEESVRREIAALEEQGIIRRYKTVINWEKAGRELVYAFIDVKVSPSRGVGFDDVAERIYRFSEVISVYLVSGDYDLRLLVAGSSMQQVAFFVAEKLATIDRVLSTATHFVLKRYKVDSEMIEEPTKDRRLAVAP
ncbi:MAG: Lrp/AsnC family transcriptional regulator [Armatimonadetes bacterium]|nr:Lrp/AsnC family transcriptional regulator [Armatimonadota bacterium]